MARLDDAAFAALGLCSRLAPSPDAKPLTAGEFWTVVSAVGSAEALVGRSADDLARDGVDRELADRCARLLGRAGALALAIEKLDQVGIWTATAGGEGYPSSLRDRLGVNAPVILHGAGPSEVLDASGIGVVGSRDVSEAGAEVARAAARMAADEQLTLVSGAARGVDQLAMKAALEAGGTSVGLLADSLTKRLREVETRRQVHDGRLCLVTPYHPDAGFNVRTAMGRNKLVYALSRVTLVVASDLESGGTWAGASEALRREFGAVAVWTGEGSGPGNQALVERGGHPVGDVADLPTCHAVAPPDDVDQEQLAFGV